MTDRPERCDVELSVRPVGNPANQSLLVRLLRINGHEYMVPRGAEYLFKAEAGKSVATLTLTLFPSSFRLVDEAEWGSP